MTQIFGVLIHLDSIQVTFEGQGHGSPDENFLFFGFGCTLCEVTYALRIAR